MANILSHDKNTPWAIIGFSGLKLARFGTLFKGGFFFPQFVPAAAPRRLISEEFSALSHSHIRPNSQPSNIKTLQQQQSVA
jgi:hypothetical protein